MFELKRQNRLAEPVDFRRGFSYGKRKSQSGITLICCKNGLSLARIGFAISSKQIKTAVKRNKIRRIAKEVFRLQKQQFSGLDFIVLVNKSCQTLDNRSLSLTFHDLFITAAKSYA